MNKNLSDYRIVTPTNNEFSASEARTTWTSIRFNNLTAAELGYPEYVRLLISQDGNTLAIQVCDEDDPCAVPFMCGRTAEDLKGQKKWTIIPNRMLLRILREKQNWGNAKSQRRFFGVPWNEQSAILFDMTQIVPPKVRTPVYSTDDVLQTYALAAQSSFLPVAVNCYPGYSPVPPASKSVHVIDADYTVLN